MHIFEVWAPNAHNVDVRIDHASFPMQRATRGWWNCQVESAGPGTNYFFAVDGGEPTPDPRSNWQPHGVHGPSRVIDHSSFRWTDQNWQPRPLASAVLYELHIGTFTPAGTFRSAIERLDHLVDLGITHVELMPVNEFSGPWGWGYDGVDLYAPHHAYGTPDDLKALVDACHQKGLAVLLDVVYNHFGPAGNYMDRFGPYLIAAYKTPWGLAVNLDHRGSADVRKFFRDNAIMWLRDYHFDGLRLDAVHAFIDRSAIHFLEYLATEVEALGNTSGRHLVLIAESDLNDPRIVKSRQAGGFGIHAQWSDDFHHALHTCLTGERNGYYEDFGSLAQLAKALQQVFIYDGSYSCYRDRLHGRPVIGLSAHHFLGYAQNHDQIGNRACGERLAHLVSPGKQKIAAALVFTSPFLPMLFQGEEFAASSPFLYFSQHEDDELGHKVSEGRKKEFAAFGWDHDEIPDPQDPQTFERAKLKWNEIDQRPHAELLAWHKKLIALRRSHSDLMDGCLNSVEVRFDEAAQWFVMRRGSIEVACNFAANRQAVPVSRPPADVIASEECYELLPDGISLPGESVAIVSAESLASMHKHLTQYATG
ncbi:MAG: malto-oligosyltrehalose trehalohydrolase [Acidobacteriaceae bacterium]|nr:malto-oligosyltrehalose trehalohydrolase [Acidobacteriaceae bacterium]